MIYLLGVTGSMGCGKTYTCNKLVSLSEKVSYIDVDRVRKEVRNEEDIKQRLVNWLGEKILDNQGFVSGKGFGDVILYDDNALQFYVDLTQERLLSSLEKQIKKEKGLILVEWGLLVEHNFLYMVDYNVLLVRCNSSVQLERVMGREKDTPENQILRKIKFQLSNEEKLKEVKKAQKKAGKGQLYVFDTDNSPRDEEYEDLLEDIISDMVHSKI